MYHSMIKTTQKESSVIVLLTRKVTADHECVQHASQRGMRAMQVNVRGMRAIHASHTSHIK